MKPETHHTPVIACVPDAIDPSERDGHFELARRLLSSCSAERVRLPDGIAFRLPPEALESVARFIANERKCCPFMTFDIQVEPNGGAVSLRMTGPAGTREIIEAELGVDSRCGCQ